MVDRRSDEAGGAVGPRALDRNAAGVGIRFVGEGRHMSVPRLPSAFLIGIAALSLSWGTTFANHNGAFVTQNGPGACGETTITATITDPNGTHKVSSMFLVVDANGQTQSGNIPTDGSAVSFTVGPSFTQSVETTTISWNVFGGGERSYDIPLWNGFGGPTFSADIAAYATQVGGFSWVIAGPDDPNPFTRWNEIQAESCAPTGKDDCKQGGWQLYEFRNQGDCVSHVSANPNSGQ
jgi:hypothetical protein